MQFKTLLLPLLALTGTITALSLPEEGAPAAVSEYENLPEGFAETLAELEALVAAEQAANPLEKRQVGDCFILCRAGADSLIPICDRLPVGVGPPRRRIPIRGPCQTAARAVGSRPSQAVCRFACNVIQTLAEQL